MADPPAAGRTRLAPDPVRVDFDRFELDEANARLLRDGRPIALAPTPFAVLCALARRPGSLLTKQALLDEVWGHQFVSESVLKTVISELRTTLDDDARSPRFIETVSRRGYRFIAATAAPALPQAEAPVSAAGAEQPGAFIGRTDALARLRRAWDGALAGKRCVVWVAGEPGIGKTTLIEHFAARLGDVLVGRGQCVEHFAAGEPYLPVLEALSGLCRSDATLVPLLRAVAPTWLLQLPWLCTAQERDALRRELAGVSPDRMLREMGELLDRSAERAPLLLITEDLHWSDRATIQLVDYVARRRGAGRLMWLASFRLAEVVALDHPLNGVRHELRLHRLVEEIVLDPFSEKEVADYVTERLPAMAADEAFVHALHERTDGLPLFVATLVAEAASRGAQGADAALKGPSDGTAVPESLAPVIDHYIAKLTGEQRSLLSAAAVCGQEFRVTTLAEQLGWDVARVGEACDQLAREQFWLIAPRAEPRFDAPEPPYAFRHALFRRMMYERTPAHARADLHRKAAGALERERSAGMPVTAAELAAHFDRGREPMAALRYYVEAAEHALAGLAFHECIDVTTHGLEELLARAAEGAERTTLEFSLLTLRGLAAMPVLGVGPGAKAVFRHAFSLLDAVPHHPMRRRLLHGYGFIASLSGDFTEALAVADRAEALSSATGDATLMLAACIVHGEVDQLQARAQAAMTWIERGLGVAEGLGTIDEIFIADPQVTLLGLLGLQLLHAGRVDLAHQALQRARTRARQVPQPMNRLVALWFDALLEVRLGREYRVAAIADEMRALVEESGLAHGRNAWRWFAGWAEARSGRPADGHRRIREGYDENTKLGMLAGGTEVLGYAVEAALLAGDADAAERDLAEALHAADARGERVYLVQLLMLEGALARARGHPTAADASLRRAAEEAVAQESPWLELAALLALCEHGRAKADERSRLATLVAQLPQARDTDALARARAALDRKHRT